MSSIEEKEASSDTLTKPLFRDITAEDNDCEITELESLCINCEEQGTTRLFLTKIPFFREVIVSSFMCDHCGNRNAELQPGRMIQERGTTYKVNVTTERDLNRQVVQTEYATISIPSLEFEVPGGRSCLTTIEGVIDRAVEGLMQDQVLRRIEHPEVAASIEEFVAKLLKLKAVDKPFMFIIDDPSGNSFVENPLAPSRDPMLTISHYSRTHQQDEQLGLTADESYERGVGDGARVVGQDDGEGFNTQNEVGDGEGFNTQNEVREGFNTQNEVREVGDGRASTHRTRWVMGRASTHRTR
jgi:zinc finger protein